MGVKTMEQFKDSMMDMLADPNVSKGDLAAFMRSCVMDNEEIHQILGDISEDAVQEVVKNDENEVLDEKFDKSAMQKQEDGFYKVTDVAKMTKELKASFIKEPTKEEARYLMDIYYQSQSKRLVIENQLRALNQDKDSELGGGEIVKDKATGKKKSTGRKSENRSFLEYYLFQTRMIEDQIKAALEIFSDSGYLGKWAKANIGIGPVIATCLMANLELRDNNTGNDTDMHPSSWWDYCGLNNNRRPWIGRAEATEIVNNLVKENNGIIDDALVKKLSGITLWKFSHYEEKAKTKDGGWAKDKLIAASCIIPYSKTMKVVMYKIGHSFLMCKNKPDSLYGRLLKQRLDYENQKNENGDYADQAAEKLRKFNIGKGTNAYKYYSKGMLPPAHINQRCERYVTKLFMSHLFEAAYYNKYGKPAPLPYILKFSDVHTDYIGPEVPYTSIPRDEEYVKIHPTQVIDPIRFEQ